jgi:hypothetical protein
LPGLAAWQSVIRATYPGPVLRSTAVDYPPGYYTAAFVFDPDGNNMEAVFREI